MRLRRKEMKKTNKLYSIPYFLWIVLFVLAPVALLFYKSFFDIEGHLTLANYQTFFSSWTYLRMSFNSILYAGIITLVTLLIAYPAAYCLTKLKHKQLWLMLIIYVLIWSIYFLKLMLLWEFLDNKVVLMLF